MVLVDKLNRRGKTISPVQRVPGFISEDGCTFDSFAISQDALQCELEKLERESDQRQNLSNINYWKLFLLIRAIIFGFSVSVGKN